jgi:hypothetical protein
MNGNLPLIIDDAKKLADAVFQVYPQVVTNYSTTIGPVSTPEQQKILFDLSVTCLAIANKESRVEKMREERKNGHPKPPTPPTPPQPPKPRILSETKTDGTVTPVNGEPVTLDDPERKPRDERDRPTEQLIQELNIRTPKEAGFLRYKKQLSFKEWIRVKDVLSAREIANGGAMVPP